MSGRQYLILSPDGARASIVLVDRARLEEHLREASEAVDEHGIRPPDFLNSIPDEGHHSVEPGRWPEGTELILEVKVVVPQPVTVKWRIPS